MTSFTQWRIRGGGYCPEGEVILRKNIPAGQYDLTGFGPGLPLGLQPLNPVKDDLVRVKDTVSDQIVSEIKHFQTLGPQFRAHGVTHKRGYLLYGPPGSGKTCTLHQVAEDAVNMFGAIVIFNSSVQHVTNVLKSVRSIEQTRPIVIMMEDVDSIVESGAEEMLLDLLDGKNTVDNVVFIGTTNYLTQLPPRIRNRPSRFDRVVKIDVPSKPHRKAYIESRKLQLSATEMERWLRDTEGFSLAHIKELILSTQVLGLDYIEARNRIRSMAEEAAKEAAEAEGKTYVGKEYPPDGVFSKNSTEKEILVDAAYEPVAEVIRKGS